jgi:glycosyltransferase involved in cell wall biosynthesis
LEILQKYFDVKKLRITTFKNPLNMFRLLFGMANVHLIYTWFAGTNAFFIVLFSRLLRKKSIVVVGGYDAAYVPEINYGIFVNRWRRVLVRFVYKHVDLILVVDSSLKNEILENTRLKIEDRIRVVPTGYDYNFWRPEGKKEDIILTVGNKPLVKGLDTFCKLAKELPEKNFIAIGFEGKLDEYMADNIKFIPFIPQNQLLKYYQKAKIFCLFSRHEGLPNVLCEAMLCECVPIGTKVNGIITAIGDAGFLVNRDIKEIKDAVEKAMVFDGRKCRERIKRLFPLEKRRKELVCHINALFKK